MPWLQFSPSQPKGQGDTSSTNIRVQNTLLRSACDQIIAPSLFFSFFIQFYYDVVCPVCTDPNRGFSWISWVSVSASVVVCVLVRTC